MISQSLHAQLRCAGFVLASLALASGPASCTPQGPVNNPLAQVADVTDGTGPLSPQTGDGVGTASSVVQRQPDELRFGGSASALTLFLRNVSAAPLSLTLSSDAAWVQLGAERLNAPVDQEVQVEISIDRSQLAEGEHAAVVAVAVEGLQPLLIPVTATAEETIADATPVSTMQVTPLTLNFGQTARSLSFLVRNRGTGVLPFTVVTDRAWITLQDASGTSEGQYESVGVTVVRTGLPPGDYTGTVTVTGGAEAAVVQVSMVVPPEDNSGGNARITVSHDELSFGNAQTERTVLVRYVGDAPATYTVRSAVAWATADVDTATNNGEYDPVHVTVSRVGLAAGDYTGELVVALAGGLEARIALRMTVTGSTPPTNPALWVSTDLLEFPVDVNETLFTLKNTGGGTFQYSITPLAMEDQWLAVSPNVGETSGEEDVITVQIDRSYLINGEFSHQLTVLTSDGQTQTLNVLVQHVVAPPEEEPPPPPLVAWPTSDENMSYVVMVQQYAVPYLGNWSCCPMAQWGTSAYLGYLTMWIEPGATEAQLSVLFEATKAYIRENIPNAVFCSYMSGGDCRRIADNQQWPYTAVPYEEMPAGAFIEDYREDDHRATVNMADLATMTLFADKIVEHTIDRGVPVIWLDNVRHPGSGGTDAPWTYVASFLGRITRALHAAGIRTVANVAMVPFALSDFDSEMLRFNVDGVCLEMPFHAMARPRTDWMEAEIGRYREWMDHGLHVELIPHWFPEGGTRDEAHDFLAGMIMIVRRPGDSIFLSHTFFEQLPHWAWWPRDFGAPLADYTIIAHDPPVYRREFEHAILTVDVGKTLDGATHGQAVQVQWR